MRTNVPACKAQVLHSLAAAHAGGRRRPSKHLALCPSHDSVGPCPLLLNTCFHAPLPCLTLDHMLFFPLSHLNVTSSVCPSLQPVLQDGRTRAQIELPELTASALMRMYKQHAPAKVPAVQAMLEANLQSAS